MITLSHFIEDALAREQEFLLEAVQDLTSEELVWRATPEANPIGWMLWHMLRVEDMWLQFFTQFQPELWERDGWNEAVWVAGPGQRLRPYSGADR